tara:strand:- start:1755 stop:1955 length:201 start_codon:yes stop_codon:yes gene_type:complete
MKILPSIAILGLILTIVPPAMHLFFTLSLGTTFSLMTTGMVLWYAAATPWLAFKKQPLDDSTQDHI